MPLISIILRTKNEERWIGRCLQMIYRQTMKDLEVIIVDNNSTDHTLEIARKYPVKIITIDQFIPGKAINMGIKASSGKFISILSAHCIPKDENWLGSLYQNIESEKVAGVYGRQLPFPYSSDLDKRDLLITFGLDHRVQIKDSFFHNANSLIKRAVWEEIPFSEELTNIEDRAWGKAVIEKGYHIVYEPEGSVYHYHGIHQNRNEDRARNIVRIMESLNGQSHSESIPIGFSPETTNIIAILPVLGPLAHIAGVNLLEHTFKQIRIPKYIKKVAVISENQEALKSAEKFDFFPINRPTTLTQPKIGIEEVLQYALKQCEHDHHYFDAVLYVNYLYPFRPPAFFDHLVTKFTMSGVDTLVPTLKDYQPYWSEAEGKVTRCDHGFMPREFKSPLQKGMLGLGTLTSSEFVRQGKVLGKNIALLAFNETLYSMKVSDPFSKSVITIALEKGIHNFGVKS